MEVVGHQSPLDIDERCRTPSPLPSLSPLPSPSSRPRVEPPIPPPSRCLPKALPVLAG
jgi:hypothetical protein